MESVDFLFLQSFHFEGFSSYKHVKGCQNIISKIEMSQSSHNITPKIRLKWIFKLIFSQIFTQYNLLPKLGAQARKIPWKNILNLGYDKLK